MNTSAPGGWRPPARLSPRLRTIVAEAARLYWCAGIAKEELIDAVRCLPDGRGTRMEPPIEIQRELEREAHQIVRDQYNLLGAQELPLLMDSAGAWLDRGAPQLPGGRAGRRG